MRFCFSQGRCTQLLGAGSAYVEARKLAPTSQQNATLRYLFFQTPSFYEAPRAPMLLTRNAVSFQLGVPANQWEKEVQAWVKFLVAVTQTTISHIAAGPGIVRPDFDQLMPELLDWAGLCRRQRMGAPEGYSNINVFALALVVALSGTIILINMSLVPTLSYLYRRYGLFQQVMVSWTQEDILQVQQKAYEGAGYTEWLRQDTAIPGLGTEEFEARIGVMRLVDTGTRRLEGTHPSSGALNLPNSPPYSCNTCPPRTCNSEEREVVDLSNQSEREDNIDRGSTH